MGSDFIRKVLKRAFLGDTPHNLRLYIMAEIEELYDT
jgi:hypothetical protein